MGFATPSSIYFPPFWVFSQKKVHICGLPVRAVSLLHLNVFRYVPNTKYQIPNTKYQIPNTKYQIPKYQIPYKHPRRVGRALLFALLAAVLLFPSCDKDEPTPDTPTTYKLTLTTPKNGTVSGHKATYKKDEITDIKATAAKGFTFSHWTGVPDADKSDNPLKLKMTKAITLAAVFVKDAEETPTYTLTLTAPKNGKVEGHKASYQKDELTDIKATAADGYHFTQWTGVPTANETQNPLKLKMTENITAGGGLYREQSGRYPHADLDHPRERHSERA